MNSDRAKLTNQQDGGEAILEAFRNLHVDYVISSPGSEWPPIWEALARQKIGGLAGPDLHGLRARDARGRRRGRLHAGHRPHAGGAAARRLGAAARRDGAAGRARLRGADAGDVRRVAELRRARRLRSRQSVVSQSRRGRRAAAADRFRGEMGEPGAEPRDALSERGARRRNGQARAARAGLSQRAGRDHDARLDAAEAAARHAGAAEDASLAGGRRDGRGADRAGQMSGHRRRERRPRSGCGRGADRVRRADGHSGDRGPRRGLRQFPEIASAASRHQHRGGPQGDRSGAADREPRAVVSAERRAAERADRLGQRKSAQGAHGLSDHGGRHLSRGRRRLLAASCSRPR